MQKGYISLFRKFLETSFFKDSYAVHIAIYLLLKANHKDATFSFNGINQSIKAGQVLTGRIQIAKDTRVKQSTAYKKLKLLENIGFCNIKSNNKFSIVTILNYESYQVIKKSKEQRKEQQSNNRVTTKEQQSNTNNNVYNVNKDIYIDNSSSSNKKNKKQPLRNKIAANHTPIDVKVKIKATSKETMVEIKEYFQKVFNKKFNRPYRFLLKEIEKIKDIMSVHEKDVILDLIDVFFQETETNPWLKERCNFSMFNHKVNDLIIKLDSIITEDKK